MRTFYFYVVMLLLAFQIQPLWAATFVVDNTSNVDPMTAYTLADGTNSLRKCIRLANASAGADVINFNIPGAGPFIISSASTLTVTGSVLIDGFTQPGAAAGSPVIQILGVTNNIQLISLSAGSDGSTVRGLVLYTNNTGNIGILANGSNNHIICGNFIGTNSTGTAIGGSAPLQNGIDLNAATGCMIGGTNGAATRNIISACLNIALRIRSGSHNTTILGNYIGTTATGNVVLTNSNNGIDINTCNNQTIGGSTYASRNVISGNQIGINAVTCTTLVVKSNFIGLGANGSTAIPNTNLGLRTQTNCATVTIGGPLRAERNVVSSNTNGGMQLTGGVNGLTIQNNYVGFDSTGLIARGNGNHGIEIGNGSTILIGGAAYNLRNVVGNNTQIGIRMDNSLVSVAVKGNFIGVAANGMTAAGNGDNGLQIFTATAVVIGGPTVQERNVISANGEDAIRVNTATGLTIQNNYLGYDSTGMADLGNDNDGMDIESNSSTILIGGSTTNLRNLIGYNNLGIRIVNGTVSTVIKGNYIGLAADGTTAANHTNNGIQINNTAALTIGGPLPAERNVIGGCAGDAINLNTIAGVTIQNNYLGFDASGLLPRNNTGDGIEIGGTSSTLLIGGSAYNLRNVIGNNAQIGLRISNGTVSTIVKGNFFGLGVNGNTAAPNGNGMEINNTVAVTVGGPLLAERNIISSNTQYGIRMNLSTPVLVQNNYVGLDSTGLIARGNLQRGISINNAASLTIGGTAYNLRNVVANNGQVGIGVDNSPGVIFKGNFIGLAKNGTTAMGNLGHGVLIERSNGALIGGPTPAERNVVASSGQRGLEINQSSSIVFVNNYVGVDSTATLMRGNTQVGVAINNCSNAIVGGTTVSVRNIVSNNGFDGIRLDNSTTPVVQGNYVGVDITGLLDFGNGETGINVYNAGVATIGGNTYSARNISSGNGQDGIFLHDNCAGSIVRANFTGVGKDGTTIIGNGQSGIRVWGGTSSNGIIIGGANYVERNVTAANGATATSDSRDGIRMEGGAGGHIVKGNFCGTDSTGTLATGYGNTWAGISINEVNAGIFGGTGANESNVSGNNGHEGIWLRNATNNSIIGNFVGTDRSATVQMGNGQFGINIRYASLNNTIGGSAAERNIVAYTKSDAVDSSGTGVFVGNGGRYNKITYNKIYCNDRFGIALQALANESIATPSITAADANSVSGTGSVDGDIIHVYHNRPPSGVCDCEGETFIGTATVSGGAWTLTHSLNLAIPGAYDVTATETTALNSTSQFSICNTALPVEFVSFTVKKFSDRNIAIHWSTALEINNSYFLVERKNEKGEFVAIDRVSGKGNYQGLSNYTSEDQNPLIGINYYRITQVDVDGRFSSTAIRAIQVDGDGLQILLTTEGVGILSPEATTATLSIYSELGQELLQKQIQLNSNTYYPISIGLQNGVYLFYVSTLEKSVWKKVPVR